MIPPFKKFIKVALYILKINKISLFISFDLQNFTIFLGKRIFIPTQSPFAACLCKRGSPREIFLDALKKDKPIFNNMAWGNN